MSEDHITCFPKKIIYALISITHTGFFNTFEEVESIIRREENAKHYPRYKGFYNKEDAVEWLKKKTTPIQSTYVPYRPNSTNTGHIPYYNSAGHVVDNLHHFKSPK